MARISSAISDELLEKCSFNVDKFVSIDEKKNSYQIIKAIDRVTYGIVLNIQRDELKQKMITDEILK